MRRPARVRRVHDEYYHSSTSTHEEFIQDIIIEDISIEGKEFIHPTGRAMSIYGLNQDNSVIVEPLMFATIELYFSKSTGRTETNILADKFIVLNNLRGKSGMTQHDTHFSGAAKVFFDVLISETFCCRQSDW